MTGKFRWILIHVCVLIQQWVQGFDIGLHVVQLLGRKDLLLFLEWVRDRQHVHNVATSSSSVIYFPCNPNKLSCKEIDLTMLRGCWQICFLPWERNHKLFSQPDLSLLFLNLETMLLKPFTKYKQHSNG